MIINEKIKKRKKHPEHDKYTHVEKVKTLMVEHQQERQQYKEITNKKAGFATVGDAVSYLTKTLPDNGVAYMSVKVEFTVQFDSIKEAVDFLKTKVPHDARLKVDVSWQKMEWPSI
jgi:di/tripeptidase